jgi:hypothetical protein
MKKLVSGAIVALVIAIGMGAAQAADITPAFDNSTAASWGVDRYAPNSFTLGAGTLDIGISNADGALNRPAGQQSTFYNTQGKSTAISGGAGDSLSAQLFVSGSWADAGNGARRTDMWGVMTDGTPSITGYPIIGFTNFDPSGFVGFRVWDDTNGWHNLSNAVNYGAWNTLSIMLSGTDYQYFVNDVLAATIAADSTTTDFSSVIMQAYNFDDPSINGAVANGYTAQWRNTPNTVSEPASGALMLGSLCLLGFIRRRTSV